MSSASSGIYPRVILWAVVVPSAFVALTLGTMYLVVLPLAPFVGEYYFPQQAVTFATYALPLYLHIGAGAVALVLGPTNLFLAARGRARMKAHRVIGIAYAASVAVSAPAGLFMAFHAFGGTAPGGQVIATTGFAGLAIAWIWTLILGVTAILRNRDARTHRKWIVINVALTFAAVTLRVYVGILLALGQPAFESFYAYTAWLCWVPNVLVAWLLIRRRPATRSRRVSPAPDDPVDSTPNRSINP